LQRVQEQVRMALDQLAKVLHVNLVRRALLDKVTLLDDQFTLILQRKLRVGF
jgi:hypothetical protein